MDKIQKIREEVVRMHNLLPVMDGDNISVNYADRICTTLEMYIDSMQEEPVSEELEKEIDSYFAKWLQGASDEGCFNSDSQLVSIYDCHRIAHHFAEWQKQQMMKDTIEGNVLANGMCDPILHLWDKGKHFVGKKVKVVVIKED